MLAATASGITVVTGIRQAKDSRQSTICCCRGCCQCPLRRPTPNADAERRRRCWGTEAIQYSNTGTAAPVIFIGYTHLAVLGAEEIENKLIFFFVGPRDERAAGPECKKQKYSSKSRN